MKRDRQPSIQRPTTTMEVSLCSLLLLVATVGASHGGQDQKESRVSQRLNSFCDDLDDLTKMLARKRDSLENHVVYLRLLADDVHKADMEVMKDEVFWSAVAVGGDIINLAGLVLEYMAIGAPYISAVGIDISTVDNFHQEMASENKQQQWVNDENNVCEIFKEIEKDLREIYNIHYEIPEKLHDFEEVEEEELLSTSLHKKLEEIKKKFSCFKPFESEQNYDDQTSQLLSLGFKLAMNAGKIKLIKYAFKGTPDKSCAEKVQVVPQKNHLHHFKNGLKVFTAVNSLYQDGKKLYKEILRLNKGARSEPADDICEVAAFLESVIEKLDRFLQKTST